MPSIGRARRREQPRGGERRHVEDMLDGQYDQPFKVIAVDLARARIKDVSAAIAQAELNEVKLQEDTLSLGVRAFVAE